MDSLGSLFQCKNVFFLLLLPVIVMYIHSKWQVKSPLPLPPPPKKNKTKQNKKMCGSCGLALEYVFGCLKKVFFLSCLKDCSQYKYGCCFGAYWVNLCGISLSNRPNFLSAQRYNNCYRIFGEHNKNFGVLPPSKLVITGVNL